MGLMALQSAQCNKVHIVFSNDILLAKDKQDFEKLWNVAGLTSKIEYHAGINFQVGVQELVIFDEADEYIYGTTQAFLDFIKQHYCICLTATSGGNGSESAEKYILQRIGLRLFENGKSISGPMTEPIDLYTKLDLNGSEGILQYVRQQAQKQAVLVYASAELKDYFERQALTFTDLDVIVDNKMLRNLDDRVEPNEGDIAPPQFRIMVASDKSKAMRGIDYRAPKFGIQLLVC
jgi:hypothetical protein